MCSCSGFCRASLLRASLLSWSQVPGHLELLGLLAVFHVISTVCSEESKTQRCHDLSSIAAAGATGCSSNLTPYQSRIFFKYLFFVIILYSSINFSFLSSSPYSLKFMASFFCISCMCGFLNT